MLKPGDAVHTPHAPMVQSAVKVVALYESLCFRHKGNNAVCFDGTWTTRGHSSHVSMQ